jgi:hypothetical protein
MRILVVYSDSPKWMKMHWMVNALRSCGNDVLETHDAAGLQKHEADVDCVLFQHKGVIRWATLKDIAAKRTAIWVQVWFDLIALDPKVSLVKQHLFERNADILREMDLVFVKEHSLLKEYWAAGVRAVWLDQGVPATIASMRSDDIDRRVKCDVLLWGQGRPHYSSRHADVEALIDKGYSVQWIDGRNTRAKCLPRAKPEDLVQQGFSSRAMLAVGRRNDVAGYVSDAYWLAVATGRPVLKRNECIGTPGLCLAYQDRCELLSKMAWVVDNPDLSSELGRNAKQWLIDHNTMELNAERLVRCVTELARSSRKKDRKTVAVSV